MTGTAQPRYTTLDDVRAYLSSNNALGTGQDGLIQDCILRAESAIDAYTRRVFVGSAGTAYYNRYSAVQVIGPALYLDQDLHTLVGIYNGDGQTIPVGSAWLEPRNEGPPYRVVRLKSSYVWTWNTDSDITLSGTWGFSTVCPDDVVQATVRYAQWLFRQKDLGGGAGVEVLGYPQGGETQYPQGMPSDVRWLLSPYRSRSGGAI